MALTSLVRASTAAQTTVAATARQRRLVGYNAARLLGNPANPPTSGTAGSQIVFAIISAGANRTFNTSCAAYNPANSTTKSYPLVYSTSGGQIANAAAAGGGDDIVVSYTYQQAANATSSLWTLNPTSSSTAIINKNLAVGPTLTPTFQVNSSTGLINALGITATGAILSTGGAIGLATQASVTSCTQLSSGNCNAGNVGQMYYNSTIPAIQFCNGLGTGGPNNDGWITDGSGSSSSALNAITSATASQTSGMDSLAYNIVWNWSQLATGTALTLADTDASATTATTLAVNNAATTTGKALAATISGTSNTGYAVYGINSGATNTGAGGYFTNTGGGYALLTGTGNVGIGTTTPYKSSLFPTPAPAGSDLNPAREGASHLQPRYSPSTDPGGSRVDFYMGANSFHLQTPIDSNERLTILSGGNVGIGTTAPDSPLTVSANTAAAAGGVPSGTLLHVMNTNGTFARVLIDTFGVSGNGRHSSLRAAEGTAASPTASQAGRQFRKHWQHRLRHDRLFLGRPRKNKLYYRPNLDRHGARRGYNIQYDTGWIDHHRRGRADHRCRHAIGIGTTAPGAPLEVRGTSAAYASNAGSLALTTAGSTTGLRFGVDDSKYSWISSFNSLPLYIDTGGNNTILNATGGNRRHRKGQRVRTNTLSVGPYGNAGQTL